MLSAMVWKEWREQRTVMLAGLGIAVTLPLFLMVGASTMARGIDAADLALILPMFYASLIWPLFAAASAAGTIANEKGEGSLGFLLSRPASRSGIWAVKMGVAACAALLVAAGTQVVTFTFARVAAPQVLDRLFVPTPWDTAHSLASGSFLTGVCVLSFGTAAFFSTLFSRSLTVTAASIGASMLLLSGMALVWMRVDVAPRLEPQFMAGETALTGLLFLAGSWWTFTRAEMLRGRVLRRTAVGVALLALGLLLAATVPLAQLAARLDPADARFNSTQVLPDGSAVVAHVQDSRSLSEQVWWIPTDGTGMRQLTGRLSLAPELSPDGKWVAYLSLRGPFGLRGNSVSLRAVRTNGSGDRKILADLGPDATTAHRYLNTGVAFSTDGMQVAVKEENRLTVVNLSTRETQSHSLADSPLGPASMLLGWLEHEVILYQWRNGDDEPGVQVIALDVQTGQTRSVFQSPDTGLWPGVFSAHPLAGGHLALVTSRREEGRSPVYTGQLIDVVSGERTVIFTGPCAPRMDHTAEVVAYTACNERGTEFTVRLLDRVSGEESELGGTGVGVYRLQLSPRGDRVLVQGTVGSDPANPHVPPGWVFQRQGPPHRFDPGLVPVGWSGRDRVVLSDRRDEPGKVAGLLLSRFDGTDLRAIFP